MEDVFSDDYLYLGVEALDDDHRRVLEIMNQLIEAYQAGAAHDVIGGAADDLIDATEKHFRDEEDQMAAANYAALETHRVEHGALIESLRVVLDAIRKENGYSLGGEVVGLLRAWMVDHILSADKVFVEFLKSGE
jgi:hemerythrin-like metal-binding protein